VSDHINTLLAPFYADFLVFSVKETSNLALAVASKSPTLSTPQVIRLAIPVEHMYIFIRVILGHSYRFS